MRKKIRKMDCIEYLSVQAPLEKVNMLEDKQSRYIHDFAKRSEFHIVGKIRRNGFSQRDVDRQWMQIVNMIRKKQISGVVVANMAAVSSSLADAYYKVGLIIEAGGVVATVDEGRLDMHIKKLNYSHVEYVINCLGKNTTKVRNIKSYLLASLFNAGSTISSYYRAEVNHDMPQFAK